MDLIVEKGERSPGSTRPAEPYEVSLVDDIAAARPIVAAVRRRPGRAERVRLAIRSALAGVALALLTTGAVMAESNVYTIQPGDNLNDVASRLGVSSSALVNANSLIDADALQVGQVLRLPDGALAVDRAAPSSRGNRTEAAPIPRNLQWPLRGPITTYYGEPGPFWRVGYHPGLDIGVPVGTPIRAIGDGVVIESDDSDAYNRGYGHYVKVDHGDGLISLYGHMSTVVAQEGQRVSAGTLLGNVGMTGFTTGPHLHLEMRQDGATRDPLKYIGG